MTLKRAAAWTIGAWLAVAIIAGTVYVVAHGGFYRTTRSERAINTWADSLLPVLTPEIARTISKDRLSALRSRALETGKHPAGRAIAEQEATNRFSATQRRIHAALAGSGRLWLGMSADDLRTSMGSPRDINRTVSARGVHEQWVYGGGRYVYIEDGVVTSWQD